MRRADTLQSDSQQRLLRVCVPRKASDLTIRDHRDGLRREDGWTRPIGWGAGGPRREARRCRAPGNPGTSDEVRRAFRAGRFTSFVRLLHALFFVCVREIFSSCCRVCVRASSKDERSNSGKMTYLVILKSLCGGGVPSSHPSLAVCFLSFFLQPAPLRVWEAPGYSLAALKKKYPYLPRRCALRLLV